MSEQGTHFWHMSFLAHNAIGLTAQSRTGHCDLEPGTSRHDAMEIIRRRVVEATPYLADATMLSFDIQRNELP